MLQNNTINLERQWPCEWTACQDLLTRITDTKPNTINTANYTWTKVATDDFFLAYGLII